MPTTARLQNSNQVDQRREKAIEEKERKKEEENEVAQVYHGASRSKDIPKIENFPKTPEFLDNTRGTVI